MCYKHQLTTRMHTFVQIKIYLVLTRYDYSNKNNNTKGYVYVPTTIIYANLQV